MTGRAFGKVRILYRFQPFALPVHHRESIKFYCQDDTQPIFLFVGIHALFLYFHGIFKFLEKTVQDILLSFDVSYDIVD